MEFKKQETLMDNLVLKGDHFSLFLLPRRKTGRTVSEPTTKLQQN